jgi:hypothetical protein
MMKDKLKSKTFKYSLLGSVVALLLILQYENCGSSSSNGSGTTTTSPITSPITTSGTLSVSLLTPVTGTTVSGTISLTASVTDTVAVNSVQYLINGVNFGVAQTVAPYTLSLNTTTYTDGAYVIAALATDASSNQATALSSINIFNGSGTPPPTGTPSPILDGFSCVGTYNFSSFDNGNNTADNGSMFITAQDNSGNITGTMCFINVPKTLFTITKGTCTTTSTGANLAFTRTGNGSLTFSGALYLNFADNLELDAGTIGTPGWTWSAIETSAPNCQPAN